MTANRFSPFPLSIAGLALAFLLPCMHAQSEKTVSEVATGDKKGGQTGVRAEEHSFTNHLEMRFVQISPDAPLFSIWETRVKDYRAFLKATGRASKPPYFVQTSDHPAVNVSWEDAFAFCGWLTREELKSGLLPKGSRYRLPTSAEWSVAVGMPALSKDSLKELTVDASASGYPWGATWPPPKNAGNYHPDLAVDDFPATAPVGSFPANKFGLYDLGGNVWEWCQDQFGNSVDFRVLRGASWRMRSPGDLLSGFVIGNATGLRLETYGFRPVLDVSSVDRKKLLHKN